MTRSIALTLEARRCRGGLKPIARKPRSGVNGSDNETFVRSSSRLTSSHRFRTLARHTLVQLRSPVGDPVPIAGQ